MQALIDNHNSKFQIVLPTLVYAEVLGVVRGKAVNQQESALADVARVREFFDSHDFIIAELDRVTARIAADLVPKFLLKGADAVVLATAQLWEARHLYTNDNDLLKIGDRAEGVRISVPPESDQLF